jgi:hypothetical protein
MRNIIIIIVSQSLLSPLPIQMISNIITPEEALSVGQELSLSGYYLLFIIIIIIIYYYYYYY